ncbi:hypothetical protein QQP08_027779 [Theobroma cacao]|nr:hypothetical protein QQP08_027779 [Theobroma cacao]
MDMLAKSMVDTSGWNRILVEMKWNTAKIETDQILAEIHDDMFTDGMLDGTDRWNAYKCRLCVRRSKKKKHACRFCFPVIGSGACKCKDYEMAHCVPMCIGTEYGSMAYFRRPVFYDRSPD